jgi:hypothetical protein
MDHNPAYQVGHNGPLTPAVRKRIDNAKNRLNLTLARAGEKFGFSGAFVSTLLRSPNPGRIRTKHIDRVIDALEKLEVEAGIRTAISRHDGKPASDSTGNLGDLSAVPLEVLLREIAKRGFEVNVRPLAQRGN